jgi:hypothetical protein
VDNRHKALGLLAAGLATAVGTVVTAADSGYRIDGGKVIVPNHNGGHVYLHLLSPLSVGAGLALTLLIAAGYFGLRRRPVRITGAVLAGVLVVLVALDCYAEAVIGSMFDETGGDTIASSPRYAVVEYARPILFRSNEIVLYVRARRSLLSYEGDTAIACFMEESSDAGAEWFLDRASVTDGSVHILAQDGTSWDVRFDPRTLRPENPVDRCTGAPDIQDD